ncbi:ABC transporter permease [Yeosuana marina]|uniref:ABC transporter permease n=1 Tax=Yeosuana marina TaxID=1565536 RepID=UPI0030C80A9C
MIFFKTYFRHLLKNKLYTSVTIIGFAISLAFIILLGVYIKNELSVDNFQVNKDRIYRLESNGGTDFSGPIAVDLNNTYPDIEDYTRVYEQDGIIALPLGEKFIVNFLAVDDSFFTIFSYTLLNGNASEALTLKNSIVLSQSYARKLFGEVSAIGKKITINNNTEFVVSGIMDDFPENTTFKLPDAIINIKAMSNITGYKGFLTDYGFCSMNMYFLETPNGNLQSKASQILKKFKKDFWLYKEGYAEGVVFTPLKDVYFSTKQGNGVKSNNKNLIVILTLIVFLILLLAVGNYVNLTIAQATFRAKEIAIKKLVGSSKRSLFFQLIKESVVLCSLAMVLALFLVKLAEPVFNSLLDTELSLNSKVSFLNATVFITFFIVVGSVSGVFPALRITSFKPIDVVKGSFRKKNKTVYNNIFITFQYTITIALLVCSFLIIKQTRFLRNYNVGFNKENIIHLPYLMGPDKKGAIKNTLEQITGVEGVTLSWGSPIDGGSNKSFDYNGKPMSFQEFSVDSSFFSVFDIKMKPTKMAYTKDGIYVNEKALKVLGFNSLPTSLKVHDETYTILGVVNDFNFNDLRKDVGPIMIHQQQDGSYASNVFVKINSSNPYETISKIKTTYSALVDNTPFEVTFVDDAINQWYLKEERTGKIISYFTVLSFIISFMGILAMATFYMQQRKKEISIRKVNGASVLQVFSLLNKNFLKWIGVAFAIAVPVSWYVMRRWLESFAYKTQMSWWVFMLAGTLTLIIAFVTISFQGIKAARLNPVDSLRDE